MAEADIKNPRVMNCRRRNFKVHCLLKLPRKKKKNSQTQTRGTHESENMIFFRACLNNTTCGPDTFFRNGWMCFDHQTQSFTFIRSVQTGYDVTVICYWVHRNLLYQIFFVQRLVFCNFHPMRP